MNNFQLYKKRDFSTYITDTITFFKVYWKNYLTNYTLITGGLLLVLCVIYFFIFRDFWGTIVGSNAVDGSINPNTYFSENAAWFITLFSLAILVTIIFSIFCNLYPISYLQLVEAHTKTEFSASEVFIKMKGEIRRIVLFFVMSILIIVPLAFLFFGMTLVLVMLIIGIPLLFLLLPTLMVWFTQSFFVYINERLSYFASLKRGWEIMISRFWHIIGATIVIYFVISTVQGIFSFIPYIIMLVKILDSGNMQAFSHTMAVVMPILYVVSIIFSYYLMNFLMIAQGMVYYSFKEKTAHIHSYSEIASIGQQNA